MKTIISTLAQISTKMLVTIYNNNVLFSFSWQSQGTLKVCVAWHKYQLKQSSCVTVPHVRCCFSQERKLCAFPMIEICSANIINYMVPLSRQTDFFVPEMKEEVKTDVKEEDSDEDRGTDITGKYCVFCPFQPNTVVTAEPSLRTMWQPISQNVLSNDIVIQNKQNVQWTNKPEIRGNFYFVRHCPACPWSLWFMRLCNCSVTASMCLQARGFFAATTLSNLLDV